MISETIQKALNEQINSEFQSAYQYLAMAAYCESSNFPGFASWMRAQSEEETGHGMRLFSLMHDLRGTVDLRAIPKPRRKFDSFLDLFKESLSNEKSVTKKINNLYEVAFKEKAYAVNAEMQWFVTEQVEEEKSIGDIVARLEMIKDNPLFLIALDQELGIRGSEGK